MEGLCRDEVEPTQGLSRPRETQEPMTITRERKQELVRDFRRDDRDTGSPEVQVAILTTRINALTEHL